MKPFLDTGFLVTLVMITSGSRAAWQIIRRLNVPICVTHLQSFQVENRLLRESTSSEDSTLRAAAADAVQRLHRYLDEMVFQPVHVDYDAAIHLARLWQRDLGAETPPALLLLWPALAVTAGATHFLSFDPRPRKFAKAAGLKLLPETL